MYLWWIRSWQNAKPNHYLPPPNRQAPICKQCVHAWLTAVVQFSWSCISVSRTLKRSMLHTLKHCNPEISLMIMDDLWILLKLANFSVQLFSPLHGHWIIQDKLHSHLLLGANQSNICLLHLSSNACYVQMYVHMYTHWPSLMTSCKLWTGVIS